MNKIKNSSMFLLWVGAAISISEIYTGCLVAPLGISKGLLAIIIGHIIGTGLLAFGGYISFRDGKNAMDKVRDSLGSLGAKIIALLNILQLIGWSAIMIIQGGRALNGAISSISYNISLLLMAGLVFIWAYSFNKHSKIINDVSVIILMILFVFIFINLGFSSQGIISGDMSFVTAIELSIAMPVSWLPLIGDYSKECRNIKGSYLYSFLGYFIGSVLMYAVGMLITINTGKDVIEFIANSNIKVVAGLIVVLSTVTTTFLDVYSAVISSKQLFKINNEGYYIIFYCVLSTVIAFFFPIESYQDFLLLIGSVFVPVYTVVFIEYVLNKSWYKKNINIIGLITVVIGIVFYNYLSKNAIGIPTVFVVILISVVYFVINRFLVSGGNVYE